ncbi:uncharacterized protein LOC123037643 [Drosophila rhopaloa]|uniref:Uncharacterized protein n=1 Tax=Drosophila rhopaloa TaxID=1041015 RepID=A0ABM5J8S3_DRORH|nr:uncharacterized protein LOC123037643 [Drosophila rhopaloa]
MSNKQKYRAEWETMPKNQKWLGRSANKMDAHCKACQTDILSRLASLKQHAATQKHKDNMKYFCGKSKIQSFLIESDNTLAASIKKAEIMFAATIAEHNISMRAMDHISDVIKHAFPDSAIAQGQLRLRTMYWHL